MLKEVFASNIAKLVAACVCPVVGASAVALKVPPVRSALHKATSPKPPREARAKPRVRAPVRPAIAKKEPEAVAAAPIQAAMMCQQPVEFSDAPLQMSSVETPMNIAPDLRVTAPDMDFSPGNCPSVRMAGGGMMMTFAAIPEPATWAQMVAGFALLGGVVRAGRRRVALPA